MEVQAPASSSAAGGQTTVNFTSTTKFEQTQTATLAAVTVGSCISAFDTSAAGRATNPPPTTSTTTVSTPINAATVRITTPTNGTCTAGFGGGGGGGGRFNGGANGGSGTPSPGGTGRTTSPPGNGSARTGGRPGGFGGASGTVTSVSGSTIVVNETNPATKATSTKTVDVTGSTTYSQTVAAAATDLAVGKCVQAVGSSNDTGAVTATSISISTPGANGCSTGFGRRSSGGGAGAGTGSSSGAASA
jgi:hypothetical protein